MLVLLLIAVATSPENYRTFLLYYSTKLHIWVWERWSARLQARMTMPANYCFLKVANNSFLYFLVTLIYTLMGYYYHSLPSSLFFRVWVAHIASVSVEFRSKELPCEKRGGRGRGRWSKETLADKPLDFENRPLGLSCLSDFMLSSAVIN